MGLLNVLEEQSSFGFTGKVNLLSSSNDQFLGVVFLEDGILVGAKYQKRVGRKALYEIVFQDLDSSDEFKYIVEPEIISEENKMFKYELSQFKTDLKELYEKYQASKNLRPPENLKLVVNSEIIHNNAEVTPIEFELLKTIVDTPLVSEIYKLCPLLEMEITLALVELRRKKAIKVFQS